MPEYKIILHGAFQRQVTEGKPTPIAVGPDAASGFYATRIIRSETPEAAAEQARSSISDELQKTILSMNPDVTIIFDVEECTPLSLLSRRIPNRGFTFY